MKDNKTHLLEVRKKLKQKKPNFLRQDAHKVKTLKKNWRFPKGIHSKMREKIKGHRRQPDIGWSSPLEVRGLTPEGYQPILISNVRELLATKDPKIISAKIGTKKKLEIVRKAKESGIKILNIKSIDEYIKKTEEKIKSKKELAKKEEVKEKKIDVKKEEKKETPEEREKREREDKKKLLEKK